MAVTKEELRMFLSNTLLKGIATSDVPSEWARRVVDKLERDAPELFEDRPAGPAPTEYLIWSEEHRSWWRPHSRGYTDQMPQAGRYPAHVAAQIVRDANIGGRFNECAVPIDAHMRAILARAE